MIHLQAVSKIAKSNYPKSKMTTKPSAGTIQQRQHVVDFLPSAVLGEANDFTIVKSSQGRFQEKRQALNGLLQRSPIKLRER
jgi:hypothetical protein